MTIYKVLRGPEWADLLRAGTSRGAPVDLADGYIHLSTAEQVATTLAKHFAGIDGLVLCACEADELGTELRWEPSRGGALFPHLYRPLRRDDIGWHADLPLTDGTHLLPPDLA